MKMQSLKDRVLYAKVGLFNLTYKEKLLAELLKKQQEIASIKSKLNAINQIDNRPTILKEETHATI